MSYDSFRSLADSWGLVMMGVFYLAFVGWAFLPRTRGSNHKAAQMIFDKDDDNA